MDDIGKRIRNLRELRGWSQGKLAKESVSYRNRQVVIEGVVKSVCQGRGCWVEVSDGDKTVLAKSLDHSVTFPRDCTGQIVRVLGTVRINPADRCGEDHAAKSDHRCPKPSMLVEISGAKLYPK